MKDLDIKNIKAFREITARQLRRPGTGPSGSRRVGRVRISAAKIISESLGFEVKPEDIRPQAGSWRTCIKLDVYRWELSCYSRPGMPFVAGGWERPTEFVAKSKKAGGCHHIDGEIWSGLADGGQASLTSSRF